VETLRVHRVLVRIREPHPLGARKTNSGDACAYCTRRERRQPRVSVCQFSPAVDTFGPHRGGARWTSFIADAATAGKPARGLHEQANPRHRLRVEHDAHTLLVHLSDEDGGGWTTIAVDRATRQSVIAQDSRQNDTA